MPRTKLNLKCPIKQGQHIRVWWDTGRPNNCAQIIEIFPYTGLYQKYFDCILRLVAPNTGRGYLEMAYDSTNFESDKCQT